MFRWFALVVLLGAVSISAFHRRRARLQGATIARREEGVVFMLGRALIAVPLFGGVVIYLVEPSWMAWASFSVPVWLRWVGVGLGLICLPLVHWVLKTLGQSVSETVLTKEHQELVTRGPYRWIRHPLYTTGILLFLALGLIAANWFILVTALLAFAAVRLLVVPLEERELLVRFGPEYERYRQSSGAMAPRLRNQSA